MITSSSPVLPLEQGVCSPSSARSLEPIPFWSREEALSGLIGCDTPNHLNSRSPEWNWMICSASYLILGVGNCLFRSVTRVDDSPCNDKHNKCASERGGCAGSVPQTPNTCLPFRANYKDTLKVVGCPTYMFEAATAKTVLDVHSRPMTQASANVESYPIVSATLDRITMAIDRSRTSPP